MEMYLSVMFLIKFKNSFVYASSKLVATIGLEDTVIVETEDAILACKKIKLRMLNKSMKH